MANNRALPDGMPKSLHADWYLLDALKNAAGSYRKLGIRLNVNQRYLWEFLKKGKVPKSRAVRMRMGINVSSAGGKAYREMNQIAREYNWNNWSEYTRAVHDRIVTIERKGEPMDK